MPEVLAPHAEMQLSQLWHAIVSFALIGIILAHIYIGSLGMEGAYDAMGSGEVDLNWAKEHHSLWVEEVQAKEANKTPDDGDARRVMQKRFLSQKSIPEYVPFSARR